MTLTFGKFKGQDLNNTPYWYQNWLNNQDWFLTKFKIAQEVKLLMMRFLRWRKWKELIADMSVNVGVINSKMINIARATTVSMIFKKNNQAALKSCL